MSKDSPDAERSFRRRQSQRAALVGQNLFIGHSRVAAAVREEIEAVADSDLNVLLTGETGVGKSLVAESIHHVSRERREQPIVVVNPAALSPSLFESELFGHARGAFTGATAEQPGAFEAAHGGTLFLDEIGDLPSPLQVKLLRAVETKMIRRVGGTKERHLNVRIVAATNRDLEQDVEAGRFRADLYQRLNEVRLHLPPLRERREDIPILFEHFLGEAAFEHGVMVEVTPEARSLLMRYDWPGNVRELRTLVRRLVGRGAPEQITEQELLALVPARLDRGTESDLSPEERIAAFSRRVYLEELRKNGYSIRNTARHLDMPYATLRSRLSALRLLDTVRKHRAESSPEIRARAVG